MNLAAGIQVAQLALKHRQNKKQQQRIIVFAGRLEFFFSYFVFDVLVYILIYNYLFSVLLNMIKKCWK